jgi:hypothetical protein
MEKKINNDQAELDTAAQNINKMYSKMDSLSIQMQSANGKALEKLAAQMKSTNDDI